jgi:hypothetical protein
MTDTTLTTEALEFMQAEVYGYDQYSKLYPDTMPQNAQAFTSVGALRNAVTDSGSFFFSPSTMRYWKSRIAPGLIGSRFFITSESMTGERGDRRYWVRWVEESSGPDHKLGVYRFESTFDSLDKARRFARKAHALIPFHTKGVKA